MSAETLNPAQIDNNFTQSSKDETIVSAMITLLNLVILTDLPPRYSNNKHASHETDV